MTWGGKDLFNLRIYNLPLKAAKVNSSRSGTWSQELKQQLEECCLLVCSPLLIQPAFSTAQYHLAVTTFVSTHAIFFSYSNCDGCSWFHLDSVWNGLQPRNKESTCEKFSPWFEVGESTTSSDLDARRDTSDTDFELIRHTFNLAHTFCWKPV